MSKYDGCGLAYVSGYDPKMFIDEDIEDVEELDEDYIWDEEAEDDDGYYVEYPEEFYD